MPEHSARARRHLADRARQQAVRRRDHLREMVALAMLYGDAPLDPYRPGEDMAGNPPIHPNHHCSKKR